MNTNVIFSYSFCIEIRGKRKTQFNVSFVHRPGSDEPYFATSACVMNHIRTDINRGGQCQKDVLPKHSTANTFFEKWDKKHLLHLNDQEIDEVLADIEALKNKYDYVSIINGKQEVSFGMKVALQRKNTKSLDIDKRIVTGMDYKIHKTK